MKSGWIIGIVIVFILILVGGILFIIFTSKPSTEKESSNINQETTYQVLESGLTKDEILNFIGNNLVEETKYWKMRGDSGPIGGTYYIVNDFYPYESKRLDNPNAEGGVSFMVFKSEEVFYNTYNKSYQEKMYKAEILEIEGNNFYFRNWSKTMPVKFDNSFYWPTYNNMAIEISCDQGISVEECKDLASPYLKIYPSLLKEGSGFF